MAFKEEAEYLKSFFSKINIKLTLLFVLVAIVASSASIYYFYVISVSESELLIEYSLESQSTAALIIILITISAGVVGFLVSKSITKPIKVLYKATKELEKGNFNIKIKIDTNDEIEELSRAFNKTIATFSKIEEERKQIDYAKTEFLSITSHELRSPMTPMKAQLQMLENEYFGKLTKDQKDSIKIVIRNADRLDKIIVDFLEISRIEAARLKFAFREINLEELVKETVKFMSCFAKEKDIHIIIDANGLPIIKADPDRVSQILRNLINNSIKCTDKGGEIIVSARLEKNQILFGVKDNGCGISEKNQMRIFEPFYQIKESLSRRHDGTGLGLAICKGIVESQKGNIWVESTLGQGCAIYFTVPLKPVYEIEPIKILFSQKEIIERKIRKEFKTMVGPLGVGEFNKLMGENEEGRIKKLNSELVDLNKEMGKLLNDRKKIKKGKQAPKLNIEPRNLGEKWTEQEFDSVFIFDENAKILDCNENMYERIGYTKSEMLSLYISDFDVLESRSDLLNKIENVKKTGGISFKTIYKRKDGSAILVHENVQYLKDENRFKCIVREECSLKSS